MNATWLALTAAAAFGITAALGFWLIPLLHKLKFGQTIREVGPKWHKNKQGTPTMGGVMFILGIVIAALLCLPLCYAQLGWETPLMLSKVFGGLLMAVGFGAIGFMDDFISIRKKRNLGLTEKQKLALQFLVAGAYLLSLRLAGDDTATTIPFFGSVDLGLIYYPLAAILIVGLTNAVNFTDGIDGLCASVSMFVFAALGISAALMNMAGLTLCPQPPRRRALGSFSGTSTRQRSLWGTQAPCFWGGWRRLSASGWICPYCCCLWGSYTGGRYSPWCYRSRTSSTPAGKGFSRCPPYTTTLRCAAGANIRYAGCSAP